MDDPSIIDQTVTVIRVAAISSLALGMSYTFDGLLKAAGDIRWIFYGRLVSQYGVLIPVAYLGIITPLGVLAVFLAMIGETAVAAGVLGHRFISGK